LALLGAHNILHVRRIRVKPAMWQNAIHIHSNLSDVEQSHTRHCNKCAATSNSHDNCASCHLYVHCSLHHLKFFLVW